MVYVNDYFRVIFVIIIIFLFFCLFNFIQVYDYIDNFNIKPRSKICIVMWYDNNVRGYADVCYQINKKYCQINGYDIIKDSVKRLSNRKPHYERIPLINKILHKYDYVVWVDSDAHFYLDSAPIENIIEKYSNKDFILSADQDRHVLETLINISTDKINTGIFIVKNTNYSKRILNIWAHDNYLLENRIKKNCWNDQGVLRLIYINNVYDFRNHSVIIPFGVLQHFTYNGSQDNKYIEKISYPILTNLNMEKPYIIHMAGMDSVERIKIAKKYILDNISYFDFSESKIENIKKLNSNKEKKKKMISSFKLLLPRRVKRRRRKT